MALLLPLTSMLILVLMTIGSANCQSTRQFMIVNNCKETVWPGITNKDNFTGGEVVLKPGQSAAYTASPGWGGRIWGRTGCNFDDKNNNGNATCETGSCGTSLNCTGPGTPPMTIAEFTPGEVDYYDVSLVDGFNIPIVVVPLPLKGGENCSIAGCDFDLRQNCPSELALKSDDGKLIGCRSACDVFKTDEYCCTGIFGSVDTCQPSNYSKAFKAACPVAYSYAYDDPTSLKTCTNATYVVSFCSSRNSTVCSYRDGSLSCSGSTSSGVIFRGWWTVTMAASVLQFMFHPFFRYFLI